MPHVHSLQAKVLPTQLIEQSKKKKCFITLITIVCYMSAKSFNSPASFIVCQFLFCLNSIFYIHFLFYESTVKKVCDKIHSTRAKKIDFRKKKKQQDNGMFNCIFCQSNDNILIVKYKFWTVHWILKYSNA